MPNRLGFPWFPRLLFRLAVAASAALIVLVFLSPLVDNGEPSPEGVGRLFAVFARDATTRRTALASAVGLTVTACIFFRLPSRPRPPIRRARPTKLPPPPRNAGA
jgi:hypothetical protein